MTATDRKGTGVGVPPFSRRMWVSDGARGVWERRLVQFAECWRQIEWLTVLEDVRACALLFLNDRELKALGMVLREFEFQAMELSTQSITKGRDRSSLHRVVIGRENDLKDFRRAWDGEDHRTIGRLLGYSDCCVTFFDRVFVEEGCIDWAWPLAMNTCGHQPADWTIEWSGKPELNLFWAPAGIRLVPHFPCRMDCPKAMTLAQAFIAVGRRAGYDAEMDTALHILSWPLEWSCLHGISEIATPILKMSHNTDVTPHRQVVRWLGTAYPPEGAIGNRFPFRPTSEQRLGTREALLKA